MNKRLSNLTHTGYHFDVSRRKNRTEKPDINIRFDNLVVVVYLMYNL